MYVHGGDDTRAVELEIVRAHERVTPDGTAIDVLRSGAVPIRAARQLRMSNILMMSGISSVERYI